MNLAPIFYPREQGRNTTDRAVDMFVENRDFQIFPTLAPFQIPDNPTWAEDPYQSRGWMLYYTSLGWLYTAEEAYKQGRFPEFPDYMKGMIFDFLDANSDYDNPTHIIVTHDGTNSYRLANLTYFYHNYFRPGNDSGTGLTLTLEEQQIFDDGLQNHVDENQKHLDNVELWGMRNHRFFHAMAQASYASNFANEDPESILYEPNYQVMLDEALEIVDEILGSVVNFEYGVTREQSFTYHRLDIGLVIEAYQELIEIGYTLNRDYLEALEKMLEFDALVLRPQGDSPYNLHLPAIGDTYYNTVDGSFYINLSYELGISTPVVEYLNSQGVTGVRPADLIDYSEAGYVIVRPEYEWENARDMRVLMDVSESLVSHGHYDNTNLLLTMYGENILIDSGGAYSYDSIPEFGLNGPFKKEYFIESEAHNVLVVDGESFDADTNVIKIEDADDYAFVAASHEGYEDLTITRNTLVLKDGVVLTLDVAENFAGALHDYELNWHLSPDALGVDAANNTEFSINNVQVDAAFASSGAANTSYSVISGRKGDDPQGWVTTDVYAAQEAPVIELAQRTQDAWFVSAFAASLDASQQLSLDVTQSASNWLISVGYEGFSWEIMLDNGGNTLSVDTTALPPEPIRLTGTIGNDSLLGGDLGDWLYGHEGDDVIIARAGDDTLYGGEGLDTIYGGNGDDIINGQDGDDSIEGGIGNDFINGADGNDVIEGGIGDDRIKGGEGNDTLKGGSGDDTVQGNDGDDLITGGNGMNRLYGREGDDTLISELNASDLLHGGDGNDWLGGYGGADTLIGADGDDTLFGGDGEDRIIAGEGDDRANGQDGNDTLNGNGGNDTLNGNGGDDLIIGGAGDDNLYGFADNDRLYGRTGQDYIDGGDGIDLISGGADRDILFGGEGNDIFVFSSLTDSFTGDADLVQDFTKGEDRIAVKGLGFTAIDGTNHAALDILEFSYNSSADLTYVNDDTDFRIIFVGNIAFDNDDFIF